MKHLLTGHHEKDREKNLKKGKLEFEGLTRKHSGSVRNLVALAAQIPRHQLLSDETDGGGSQQGYWSNPEDQV